MREPAVQRVHDHVPQEALSCLPEPWLYSLAYQQFTPEELSNGAAIEILIDKGFL